MCRREHARGNDTTYLVPFPMDFLCPRKRWLTDSHRSSGHVSFPFGHLSYKGQEGSSPFQKRSRSERMPEQVNKLRSGDAWSGRCNRKGLEWRNVVTLQYRFLMIVPRGRSGRCAISGGRDALV